MIPWPHLRRDRWARADKDDLGAETRRAVTRRRRSAGRRPRHVGRQAEVRQDPLRHGRRLGQGVNATCVVPSAHG